MDTKSTTNRPPKARLSIRPSTYRGEAGHHIVGKDGAGRSISIFTYTRASAEVIRAKTARGEEIDISDYYIEDEPDLSIPNPPVAGQPCPRAGCDGHLRFSISPRGGFRDGAPLGPATWTVVCRTDRERHGHHRHELVPATDSLSAAKREYVRIRDEEGGWPADPVGTPYWMETFLEHGLMVGFAPHPTERGRVQCVVTGDGLKLDSGWQPTMADALHAAFVAFTEPKCECGRTWPPASNYSYGCPEICSSEGGCGRCYISNGLAWKRAPKRDTVPAYHDHIGFAELDLETGVIAAFVYQFDGQPQRTELTFRGGRLSSPGDFWTEGRGRRRNRIAVEADDETRAKAQMLAQRVLRGARPELLTRLRKGATSQA
jgi:hypothetical protein